jgi:DNA-directed RNA polymerase III subunit RPC3
VVLIQTQLVLHHTSAEDGATYYEANWKHAYSLVRCGDMVEMVEKRLGITAAGVVTNLILSGNTRVGDLIEAYDATTQRTRSRGGVIANGDITYNVQKESTTSDELYSVLNDLLRTGYIIPVRTTHFSPATDIHNEAERRVTQSRKTESLKGKKGRTEMENEIRNLKRKWRGDEDWSPESEDDSGISKTSQSNDSGRKPKRRKLEKTLTNGVNGVNGVHRNIRRVKDVALKVRRT